MEETIKVNAEINKLERKIQYKESMKARIGSLKRLTKFTQKLIKGRSFKFQITKTRDEKKHYNRY